jgi:hypothetical protein
LFFFCFFFFVEKGQWNFQLQDVKIGGVSLGLTLADYNHGTPIIDSTTTLLVVTDMIMYGIKIAFEFLCTKGTDLVGVCGLRHGTSLFDGFCFAMTDKQIAAFPDLTLHILGWGDVTWESSYYLWEGTGAAGLRCLGIQAYPNNYDQGVIFGAILMQKYHIFFDREGKQAGIADKSTCPTPTF